MVVLVPPRRSASTGVHAAIDGVRGSSRRRRTCAAAAAVRAGHLQNGLLTWILCFRSIGEERRRSREGEQKGNQRNNRRDASGQSRARVVLLRAPKISLSDTSVRRGRSVGTNNGEDSSAGQQQKRRDQEEAAAQQRQRQEGVAIRTPVAARAAAAAWIVVK
jgi:hypothetical protein